MVVHLMYLFLKVVAIDQLKIQIRSFDSTFESIKKKQKQKQNNAQEEIVLYPLVHELNAFGCD